MSTDMEMDDKQKNLLHLYQSRYFHQRDPSSAPSQSSADLRCQMAFTRYAHAAGFISEDFETALMKKHADEYALLVDLPEEQNGLDNFAREALQLSHGSKNESHSWTSSLTLDSVNELECIKSLRQVCQASSELLIPPGKEQDVIIHLNNDTSVANRNTAHRNDGAANVRLTNHQPLFKTTSMQQPRNPMIGSNNISYFKNEEKMPVAKRPFYDVTNEDQEDDGRAAVCKDFKTAREQLIIDSQKKFSNRNSAATASSYGTSKRSLGTRRGTSSKFVPPVMNRENDRNEDRGDSLVRRALSGKASSASSSPAATNDEILDERLKNIEPKMVELIMNEIMEHGPPVTWADIAGLEFAKSTIMEIVVWPMLRPDIFTGLRGPPKGLLLFGPPGTGKTMIGKCIASQSKSTFFSISASSLTSKWVGEGEKMVRALFAVARCHQPAVVFIDEIDSLLSQRTDGEHEASRRIKTEFLVQLDGATTGSEDRILVVGATNRPQEIDEAARRRFVKRLYIPLPEGAARKQIVTNLMTEQAHELSDPDLDVVCSKTDGFSGADMATLCREAALGPIRSLAFHDIENISADQVRPILFKDFEAALMNVRASVSQKDLEVYLQWNQQYGSGGR